MAAMTESVNMKVVGVLALVTVLMVLNVTIGMQAFVRWADSNQDYDKQYAPVLAIQKQQARERQDLSSVGYSVERQAYRIPIEQAMDQVLRSAGQ